MTIALVFSTGRQETAITRQHEGRRFSLVVWCPWGQPPAETLTTIRNQLTNEEAVELYLALGLTADRSPA
jgi:hypothetical protein